MMLVTGAASWLTLWRARRTSFGSMPWAVLGLALLTLLLMARTGTMGGEIRHPEIVAEGSEGTHHARAGLAHADEHRDVRQHRARGCGPRSRTLHFIGLWMLFGVILMVNLRLLGMMK
jgi:hypothetical protein